MKILDNGFIEVEITSEMVSRASEKAKEMGALRNSIRRGEGNLAGFLGEEVVLKAFPGSTSHNTYQHDITMEHLSIEVKTKDRTVEPRIDYEASVANFNTSQKADFYVFVSLYRPKNTQDYQRGFVLGVIEKEAYKDKATYLKVGDIDPSNGWEVKAACYNLPYSRLVRFESLKDE
jgi:hypothetical protein